LRGEIRIVNGVVVMWRENVERNKVKMKKEKEGDEVSRELSHTE
jgi:hypothetical protein